MSKGIGILLFATAATFGPAWQGCGGSSHGGGNGDGSQGGEVADISIQSPDVAGRGGSGGGGVSGGGEVLGAGGSALPCGQPGLACCAANACQGGGCCVSGICLAVGASCSTIGGDKCNAGTCGTCGGPGLPCCGTNPSAGMCTAPAALCSGGICVTCGRAGDLCCPGSVCDSPGCCYGNTCVAETTACGSAGGLCKAGRCSGCGSSSQACCASACYDGLYCRSNACISCGNRGEACCPAGAGSAPCVAGNLCVTTGTDAVCARCGGLGDPCCAGSLCADGCCSGGRCVAGALCVDAGVALDGPISGTGGRVGTGAASGAGGSTGTGGTTGTGGKTGTGGATGAGGKTGTGGVSGTGGKTGTGGAFGTGGIPGTGGTGTGGVQGTGGSSCIALLTSAADFETATEGMTGGVENFTRDASGAAVPTNFFAITYGTHYYLSNQVTFLSVGVQPADSPGVLSETIAGAYGSIMSDSGGAQARDGLVANLVMEQKAIGLVINDDEGSQTFTLVVWTSNATTYNLTATVGKSSFVGVVSQCSAIQAIRILPPIPSHWWRLQSLTFAL